MEERIKSNKTGWLAAYLSDLAKVTDELGLTRFIRGNNGSLHNAAAAEMDLSAARQKDFSARAKKISQCRYHAEIAQPRLDRMGEKKYSDFF